jgi:hypothetical protein
MNIYTVKNDKGSSFEVDEDKLHEAEKDGYLPTVSNGQQEHRVALKDIPLAMKDGYKPVFTTPEGDKPSTLKSGVLGTLGGLTGGFFDEIAGGTEALRQAAIKGSLSDLGADYRSARDEMRGVQHGAEEAHPIASTIGKIGGGIGSIAAAGIAAPVSILGAATQGAAIGGVSALGETEASRPVDMVKDMALGATIGGVTGGAIHAATPYISEGLSNIAGKFGNKAEELAVKATGATPNAVNKFEDNAGRELLDRGLVKFGDTTKNIAERVGEAESQSGINISKALGELDAKGASTDLTDVIGVLQDKAQALKSDPSKAGLVKQIGNIIEDFKASGTTEVPLSKAEEIKRGFGDKIKNWVDKEAGLANKEAYEAIRSQVEQKALAKNPELASKFIQNKKDFGLLSPIEDAVSKAVNKQNQSNMGLVDKLGWGSSALSLMHGNPTVAAGMVAKTAIAPRLTSSLAITADGISKILQSTPEVFGKYSSVLQKAAGRGAQALAASHYVLQQQDQQYRELMNKIQSEDK